MLQVLYVALVVILALSIAMAAHKVRNGSLSSRLALIAAVCCSVGLLTMVLTDWPWEILNSFWSDHSVLTGLLSSVLFVGVVFFVYERGEQQRQDEMAKSLSGAGVGGIVDHIIDIETALAILVRQTPPEQVSMEHWAEWRSGRPLRWLRSGRDILTRPDDPRKLPVSADGPWPSWGQEILDQSIRRLLAGMRDWAPLICASKDGTSVLLLLSTVRTDLMCLRDLPSPLNGRGPGVDPVSSVESIRMRLRVFAVCFEEWSGVKKNRREVLTTFAPLSGPPPDFGDISKTLAERLDWAVARLREEPPLVRQSAAANT